LQRARELRLRQTPAEKILWECLRGNRLFGFKFRRQHNIGQYIADFYCHAAKLVIELDGEIHQAQTDRDSDRDSWLEAHGLTVLRFKNNEITENLEQVLQTILSYLPSSSSSSSYPPSPVGEGQGVRAVSAPKKQGERATPTAERTITKLDIFHYTYAVLHHPAYRKKYELNLKREFPRLPFYNNFFQWVEWGKQLMDLHLNHETIEPYGLTRTDATTNTQPKAKLKADKEKGYIDLDGISFLQDIPAIAWDYKLGNRSALEWILDQYKEKKPKDPTIAKLFNTYRFADYKEHVIDLLQRVCTVSVETMEIIGQMPDE
jgi:very-short-patch-repair endonuclease